MKPLLIIAGAASAVAGVPDTDIEVRQLAGFPTPAELAGLDAGRPTVVLASASAAAGFAGAADIAAIITVGNDSDTAGGTDAASFDAAGGDGDATAAADGVVAHIPHGATPAVVRARLKVAFRHAAALAAARAAREELTELTQIGVALSTERNLLTLLEQILTQARRISASDAGSIYLVERGEEGTPTALRFKLSQNSSLPDLPLREFTVPIDHGSLAGYAASTGEPLVIDDVYLLPGDVSYRLNRSFDEKFGYRTKSVLVLPMRTHRDEVVGVLQLINREGGYDRHSVELVTALASQAAVSIENSLLYEDIERLFEGFVTASVTAIESRDPTTSGHSARVATMSVALAEAVDKGGGHGAHRGLRFNSQQLRELRYAGLLHDFGKVGVREQVLVKEKKLYPLNIDIIRLRFAVLGQAAQARFDRERAEYLLRAGRDGYDAHVRALQHGLDGALSDLDRLFRAILTANEPTGEAAEPHALPELAGLTFRDLDGECRAVLTGDELRWLSIRRGTLDETERREIESHVTHTFRFLRQIPWTRELRHIPEIAFAHHEKLNGQGYPRAIGGDAIPVQARIMTIADIYDALTASDRPYKRAVTPEQALDILHDEARGGALDADLLETFVAARVYVA